jgi:hypothetical protein
MVQPPGAPEGGVATADASACSRTGKIGKAAEFDSAMRRFESSRSSHDLSGLGLVLASEPLICEKDETGKYNGLITAGGNLLSSVLRELPAMRGRRHYSVHGEIEIGLCCANIRLRGATKNEGLGPYDQRHLRCNWI